MLPLILRKEHRSFLPCTYLGVRRVFQTAIFTVVLVATSRRALVITIKRKQYDIWHKLKVFMFMSSRKCILLFQIKIIVPTNNLQSGSNKDKKLHKNYFILSADIANVTSFLNGYKSILLSQHPLLYFLKLQNRHCLNTWNLYHISIACAINNIIWYSMWLTIWKILITIFLYKFLKIDHDPWCNFTSLSAPEYQILNDGWWIHDYSLLMHSDYLLLALNVHQQKPSSRKIIM